MEWIEPVEVKSTVKYSSSLISSDVGQNGRILSGSFPDLNVAWFAAGNQLDVVSTTHNGVQSRRFQCSQGQEFEVMCVASIPNEQLALVGLSSSTGSGAVALYNYHTSLILKSWSVSHKVTCVCAIDSSDISYRQFLKADCFLFAVGTEEGHVMLLAIDQQFKCVEATHRLDLDIVHYVTTDEILKKRALIKPPVVVVIPLNDSMYRAGKFEFSQDIWEGTTLPLSVKPEEIKVSVVKYIPQNKSLCVGYNIEGAFQMFCLKTLVFDFSGFAQDCNGDHLNQILDFAFLEPEDDPRHYCYLTVVGEKSCGSVVTPFAILYSLTYEQKDASPTGVILYEKLQFITLRLDLNFGPLLLSGTEDGSKKVKLIACRSLPSSFSGNSTRAAACSGLCYFSLGWNDTMYLAIFDLNQWYQAQMPSRWIFTQTSSLCPFLGFYHAEIDAADTACQVWIQPATMSIFHRSSTTPAEPFFFPSALSFRLVMVSLTEVNAVLFLGMQSLLLQRLSLAGSQALNQPHRFYVQAVRAGLAAAEVVAPNVPEMAEALLNIGLENNTRAFLISCIKDEGANLNSVEKWAWQKVVDLKAIRECICQILFDHSAHEMEQQMHNQLYHVTHQFGNLAVLYDVMDKRIRALNSGVNDKLRDKARAIYLLSLHLETVLWFLHGRLLPEADEGEIESPSLPYPRLHLDEFYRSRKAEVESLSSTIKSNEVLLIEQLIPSSVAQLWVEERGSNELSYPPPSLYALLSAYLRPDVDDVTKHRIVQYVFMDLVWIYGGRHPHYGNILQHLMTFPATYSIKPSIIKVTQAFWHLDHQNFDDALSVLLDPLVHAVDITNAQQRAILRSFLYQNQRRHALKYATLRHPVCPELEDIQLHLTILIANSLISDALSYVRRNKNQRNSEALMQHLLCGCREMRKFSVLLTLPLGDEEEEQITTYLKQSRNIDLQEALLLFYIQRCKYPDAIAYSERLNQMWPARDAQSRERFNRREMLMQTLINALPPITCKLASIANSRSTLAFSQSKFPTPLSVAVLPSTSKVQCTGSAFFRTVIEQSRATWLIEEKLHHEAQTPLKSRKRKLDHTPTMEEPDLRMEAESTPFLCNIVQPSKRNVTLGMSLCFPSPKFNATCAMDITEMGHPDVSQNEDDAVPRQGKRPRFSLFPKSVAAAVLPKTNAEVVSVLQTPPVHRRRPSIINEAGSSCNRPSSILKDKMRRFMNFEQGQSAMGGEGSESENDMEMSTTVVDSRDPTAAKHLRFSLPQATSPSETEVPISSSSKEDEMEVVEETQKSFSGENTGDDTQKSFLFLSFEEEAGADPVPVPSLPLPVEAAAAAATVTTDSTPPTTPEEETVASIQAAPAIEAADLLNASCESMELTTMAPAALLTASHFVEPETSFLAPKEQEATQQIVQADVEPEPSYLAPKEPEVAQQTVQADEDSNDDDIVCLDSSSEEEKEEEQSDEEEEENQEEEEYEDEQCEVVDAESEEETDQHQVHPPTSRQRLNYSSSEQKSEGESEESNQEECVVPEETSEESQEAEFELPVGSRNDDVVPVETSEESQEAEFEPLVATRDDDVVPVETSEESQEAEFELPVRSRIDCVEDELKSQKDENEQQPPQYSASVVLDSKDESNEMEMESNDEMEPEPRLTETVKVETKEKKVVFDSTQSRQDSDEEDQVQDVDSSSSVGADYQEPAFKSMSTSNRSRFVMPPSDDSLSQDEYQLTDEMAEKITRRSTGNTSPVGYSKVESDIESEPEQIPTSSHAQNDLEVAGAVEKPHAPSPSPQPTKPTSGYSKVESDFDDDMEDEEAEPSQVRLAMETMVDSSQFDSDSEAAEDASGEEEEEDEEADFELQYDDTPSSNVSRRRSSRRSIRPSLRRRRFDLSNTDSSDDDKQEVGQEEEQAGEQPVQETSDKEIDTGDVRAPEISPQSVRPERDSSSDTEEASKDENASGSIVRRETITTSSTSQRISVYKSRLQLTDSESSEEEVAEEKDESNSDVEPSPPAPTNEDDQPSSPPAPTEEDDQLAAMESGDEEAEIEAERTTSEDSDESVTEENKGLPSHPEGEEVLDSDSSSRDTEPMEAEKSSSDDSTDEHLKNMKEMLESHPVLNLPQLADAGIITAGTNELSVIMEDSENSLLGTTSAGLKVEESTLAQVEEEDEEEEEMPQQELAKINEEEEEAVVGPFAEEGLPSEPSSSVDLSVNPLDAAAVDENLFEAAQSRAEEEEEEAQEEPVPQVTERRKRGRPKSLKLSQVPLPFSSRRSTWDADRSSSPDSVTSEPPQTFEEMVGINTKSRRRHHSTNTTTSVPAASVAIAPRRSTRLATSICEAPDETPTEETAGVPNIHLTPPKVTRRRSAAAVASSSKQEKESSSVPPSVEVSPSDSIVSGRGSVTGTPTRRSTRLLMREMTPEPSASADLLVAALSARIRRNSTGMGDTAAQVASPLRRSGRKSANVSRDNSPDSVTSEPLPRTENTTPIRKKPIGRTKSAQKSKQLFSVIEEPESVAAAEASPSPSPAQQQQQLAESDGDESSSNEQEEPVPASGNKSMSKQTKKTRKPVSVNLSASPSSTRYNLRTRRASELDIISEEGAAAAAAVAQQKGDSSSKRPRDEGSAEGESSDQAVGPSVEDNSTGKKKRTVNKRQKKNEEEQSEETEELHFAPASRPPPKGVPKRDPVIKSTRSRGRRVLHLHD